MIKLFHILIVLLVCSSAFAQTTKNGTIKVRKPKKDRAIEIVVSINDKYEGEISKKELCNSTRITTNNENYVVRSFVMTIAVEGDFAWINTRGDKITPKMCALIDKVEKGTKIYFENIVCISREGVVVSASAIRFVIGTKKR